MQTKINKAAHNEADKLFPLVLASQLFQKKDLEKKPLDENKFERENRRILKKWISDSYKEYFVAKDAGGEIVGFVLCMIDNQVSQDGSISDLYVKPECRGKGIGELLVRESLKWLKESGIKHVTLAVHKKNIPAIKVYGSVGFSEKDDNYLLMGRDI